MILYFPLIQGDYVQDSVFVAIVRRISDGTCRQNYLRWPELVFSSSSSSIIINQINHHLHQSSLSLSSSSIIINNRPSIIISQSSSVNHQLSSLTPSHSVLFPMDNNQATNLVVLKKEYCSFCHIWCENQSKCITHQQCWYVSPFFRFWTSRDFFPQVSVYLNHF